ncbi:DUF1540 domain-containing protein [Romboutsia sp. 1001713B170207_170306_H8]|uniref:DUF1540 domain-containing protein n=1 Tax=Romboutsia sp. 1001713B170207_170306_H8 TaxID=2787112 RepID=UPI0008207CAD|nr:DUF1540 domain-containing protein [Romboutsia sp. 1001713B170207_170306_H8]SCH60965.1 Domain of Uncharacterised Function (DUF1540) [uncultured Clostridium sp.]
MDSNLNCQAYNCTFNKNNNCHASHIKVEGFDATITPETYCNSFKDKNTYNFSNYSTDTTNLTNTQNISCSASNCTYNVSGSCNASHVDISFENASCETFKMSH